MLRQTVSFLAAIALAGCAAPVPVQEAPPATSPGAETLAPAPEVPNQPAGPALPANLFGEAKTKVGPFAGAAVTATLLGGTQALASATSGADGSFGLALPASVPAGALLKVVAHKDGQSLAAIVAAPAERAVQADAGLQLSEASTLALLLLNRRFDALGQASRNPQGHVLGPTVQTTLQAFQTLTDGCRAALDAQQGDVSQAVQQALGTDGQGVLQPAIAQRLGSSQSLVNHFHTAAQTLGAAIVDAFRRGGTAPSADLLASLPFSGNTAPRVTLVSSGGSSGGGRAPETTATGALVITEGDVVHTGTEGIQLSN